MRHQLFRVALILVIIIAYYGNAKAQTLKADYQFQGNLASSVAGVPELANLTGTGNGPNTFGTEQVDGFSRQVLNFPLNNGVAINALGPIVPNTESMSLVILFKFAAVTGKRRVLDASGGTAPDEGGWLIDGRIGESEGGSHPPTDANSYFQITMVRSNNVLTIYRDNIFAVSDVSDGGPITSLRFFQDWAGANPIQASAGSIARLRIYDGPLSLDQIHQLDRVPEAPSGNRPILFYSSRNGTTELFRMNTDGASQVRTTNNEVAEILAKFSPNGQKIVYQRRETPTSPWQIWTANADGTNPVRLTNTATVDKYPTWRPDGQKILFSRCSSGSCDLYTMNPDGSSQSAVAVTVPDEDLATYTPDGTKLVFSCSDQNQTNYQICVSNADGSERTAITGTSAPVLNVYANVSPDGTKIAYIRDSGTGDVRVVVMNINGTNPLTWPQTNNPQIPVWSPDGTKILYSGQAGNLPEVFVANSDGTSPVRLTTNSAIDIATDWYRPQTSTTRVPFDFDGDGKTDIGIYRPNGVNGSEWWISKSSNDGVFATQFGAATDSVVAADYTGDGKADVAFWRPSTGYWYVLRSEDMTYYATPFGTNGDVPVPADYDADGKADTAVFRPSNSTWYIDNTTGGITITGFGAAGDKPVTADYDGDGKADIAVFRPNGANGAEWWIRKSSDNSVFATQFGSSTDKAVPADYTGDGKADVAFWAPSGTWYILRSEDLTYYADQFGTTGDVPSPGDYDGDGKADAAVFRPTGSTWYVKRSTAGLLIKQFGSTGDIPVPSIFVR
ncbi:MAG: PD40 domain-containing protein [Acidobacteria bacterium]|nr:PD40 domain-containing protein [Acidobacteriota bacterium]